MQVNRMFNTEINTSPLQSLPRSVNEDDMLTRKKEKSVMMEKKYSDNNMQITDLRDDDDSDEDFDEDEEEDYVVSKRQIKEVIFKVNQSMDQKDN